jgi:hypothetical protein
MIALALALSAQAQAQDQEYYVNKLWDAMRSGDSSSLWKYEHELKVLVQQMIRAQHYVCDQPHRITGEGDTPRGRYAWVGCEGTRNYRVDLWADKNTYTVRPWIDGIDD